MATLESPVEGDDRLSPIGDDAALNWLDNLGLIGKDGSGVAIRAVIVALVAWLPIAGWAAWQGRLLEQGAGEPLLGHFGVHVRCLVALPLLILGDTLFRTAAKRAGTLFLSSGLVTASCRDAYERTIRGARVLVTSPLTTVLLVGMTLAWLAATRPDTHEHELVWAGARDGALGFGGAWYAYFVRPLFVFLVLRWLWRMAVLAWWLWRVGRIDLSLVPSHPDRSGGLAFVARLPHAYALLTLVLSAVLASRWAHELEFHDADLKSFVVPLAIFAVLWTMFALLPVFAIVPRILKLRKFATLEYAALAAEQGRLVRRRWILREKVADDPVLDASEIGPVADMNAMYDAVDSISVVPLIKAAIGAILLPIAIPMLAMAAIKVPIGQLLLKVLKLLV